MAIFYALFSTEIFLLAHWSISISSLVDLLSLSKTQVCIAPGLLIQLLETASMTVQEPTFQVSVWRSVMHLPKNVIVKRFSRVAGLKKDLSLTEAEAINVVWNSTMYCMCREHWQSR